MTQRQRRRPPERDYARRRPPQRGRPAQDPRRQRNARRPAPRRRRRVGKWLLAVPVVALLVWLVLTHYVFLIRNVTVIGAGDMAEADVVRLSGIPLGGRLNAVDKAALRTRLESTGRLAFVSAERKYPDTIVLTVRQRSRDAITLQAGKLLVLDSDGYVVSVGDVAPEDGMPYVMGLKAATYRLGKQLDAPESRLGAMKAVLDALKAHNAMGYVSEINLEHLSDIELIARKGIVVSLGNSENMNNKIIWMVGALQDLESRGETLGRLDVSSGSKADFLSGATPTPAPTPTPVPEITPEAVIGEDVI
ncbi:MAG: FtsQ-type POTRA domain-containing protein [Clostridia bacterium]|nr:FtsQ-type POTRA domain-containing protein [Clostridia bacterium]